MKFAAAILLFAQFANADGHADATTTMEANGSTEDHSLDAHLALRHQQLHMAISMVEKFCTAEDSNTTDDDGDDPNDTTDNDGNTDGDNDTDEIDTSIPLMDANNMPQRKPTAEEAEEFHSAFESIMEGAEHGDPMMQTLLEDMKMKAEMMDISLAQHYPEIWLQEKLEKTVSVLQDRGINRELCM